MKKPDELRRENAEGELLQYVLDRPELILKMLDIAETLQERRRAADCANATVKTNAPRSVATCG